MPPVRKPKPPLSAWIVEQRTRQTPPWKSEELAARLHVSESTVRGWEAGRSISEANLVAMERLFGVQAPGSKEPGQSVDVAGLVVALRDALQVQAQALTDIRLALADAARTAQEQRETTADLLGDLSDQLDELLGLAGKPAGSAEPGSRRN